MNKYYIIALLLIISISTNAQIKKGSILLGGDLSYYTDKIQIENLEEKLESGSIGISIGKAFKENSFPIPGIKMNQKSSSCPSCTCSAPGISNGGRSG